MSAIVQCRKCERSFFIHSGDPLPICNHEDGVDWGPKGTNVTEIDDLSYKCDCGHEFQSFNILSVHYCASCGSKFNYIIPFKDHKEVNE